MERAALDSKNIRLLISRVCIKGRTLRSWWSYFARSRITGHYLDYNLRQ